MKFFMSGTPRNDQFQAKEDALCTERLFSLHGDYRRAVERWVECVPTDRGERVVPREIMLDSGAFTAWNKGHHTSIDEVLDSYAKFMELADDKFDQIWMINLDVIPGERGRDPTPQELADAVRVSDENFETLSAEFGPVILPVFHQGEPSSRLLEVASQSEYVCVSPRNDVHEAQRVVWAEQSHKLLAGRVRTHGLATTGNKMLAKVPWSSVDSAAWVLHGGYGKLDFFIGDKYVNVFISDDAGKDRYFDQHFNNFAEPIRQEILARIETYGFSLEQVKEYGRVRGIVNMGELLAYARWITSQPTEHTAQGTLFGV